MTVTLAIQKNLDGSYPGLTLKDIFAFSPAARALYSKAVMFGFSKPLPNQINEFMTRIKPEMQRLVGWDAQEPALSSAETYETFYRALEEAADCWHFYLKNRHQRWGWAAFKTKFGVAPRFDGRDIGGAL